MSDTPSTAKTRPVPVVGLRRKQRASGESYLVGTLHVGLALDPGTQLDLRRLHDGSKPGPEFCLVFVPPVRGVVLTKAQRDEAAGDRFDASAIRIDPRDGTEQSP